MKSLLYAEGEKRESQTALELLEDFFDWYSVDNARQELWDWLKQVAGSEANESTPLKCSEAFFFYEKLISLIDASYVLLHDNSSQDDPVYA